MTVLTGRFVEAVDLARTAHRDQFRKGTRIPYVHHLLAVAALVLEYGGTEDQAIAGLLHDLVEDCGDEYEAVVRERFGDTVAAIVMACTDGTAEGKRAAASGDRVADWRARKLAYLRHLREAPDDALLVSACDKLHNATSIVTDLEDPAIGTAVHL
jgi:(p)ppGpp synthase/HD superfamily hydrolase